MKILLLPNAACDLEIGADFYDAQQQGIGEYFLASLTTDIESLKLYAGIHAEHLGFYRVKSKRFPFAIYYQIRNETIIVFAVLDCRMRPKDIQERLGREGTR